MTIMNRMIKTKKIDAKVETVTAIHNLAVCFVHLARHGEALAHFNLAHAVFEVLLGVDFPRTQVITSIFSSCSHQISSFDEEFKI